MAMLKNYSPKLAPHMEKIAEMTKKGMYLNDIAERYGVDKHTISSNMRLWKHKNSKEQQ